MFCHQSEQLFFSLRFIDHLCECVYVTEGGKKAPVHLIDNRCKSPSKGVKGRCCHGNSVWVNANGLGAGLGLGGVENWEEGGGRVQRSLLQLSLDKGTTSPSLHLPPGGCWCREVLGCDGIDLDTTPTATPSKPHWPFGNGPVQTSSAATMAAGGLQWHRLTAPRPPPICLPSLHTWPFYRLCLNRGGRWNPRWLPLTPRRFISKVQWRWSGCLILMQKSPTGSFWQWHTDKWDKLFSIPWDNMSHGNHATMEK